jgi:hypothetical protein
MQKLKFGRKVTSSCVNPALGQHSVHTQQERACFGSACNNLPASVPEDGTEIVSRLRSFRQELLFL